MAEKMTAATLKSLLDKQATFALIDVRDAGEYNDAHIPGACLVPRRQLEFRMHRLVPCLTTQVIVCDDDERRARLAAATLESMGFRRVAVLAGGINRWSTEGNPTEWGVNVPSKDFGEKVQVVHRVPEIHPEELRALQQKGEKVVLLDSRTPEEHRRATIPGGRSAPNGEVALHIADLAPDPEATIRTDRPRIRTVGARAADTGIGEAVGCAGAGGAVAASGDAQLAGGAPTAIDSAGDAVA